MSNMFEQMAADVNAAPGEVQLSAIAAMAERQLDLQRACDDLADKLANAQRQLKQVQEEQLPTLLQECGVSEFKLVNGAKITIKKFYSGSIGDENRDQAFDWLKTHQHDDLIKNDYTVAFGKGEDSDAETFEARLTELGVPFKHKKHVHPQTLAAFIREQIEGGCEFPLETFKAYIGQRAIIK